MHPYRITDLSDPDLGARVFEKKRAVTSTRALAVGEDLRAGRWWWEAVAGRHGAVRLSPRSPRNAACTRSATGPSSTSGSTSNATIRADYLAFAERLGLGDVRFIPISALNGDMVVERGPALDGHRGPTLLAVLEHIPAAHTERPEAFRLPVQYVCRPREAANPRLHDYRGFMGRVESGAIARGSPVTVLPSGRQPHQGHPDRRHQPCAGPSFPGLPPLHAIRKSPSPQDREELPASALGAIDKARDPRRRKRLN